MIYVLEYRAKNENCTSWCFMETLAMGLFSTEELALSKAMEIIEDEKVHRKSKDHPWWYVIFSEEVDVERENYADLTVIDWNGNILENQPSGYDEDLNAIFD